jgi:hypothetical protein
MKEGQFPPVDRGSVSAVADTVIGLLGHLQVPGNLGHVRAFTQQPVGLPELANDLLRRVLTSSHRDCPMTSHTGAVIPHRDLAARSDSTGNACSADSRSSNNGTHVPARGIGRCGSRAHDADPPLQAPGPAVKANWISGDAQ